MPKAMFMALANPTSDGDEAEFDRWYEEQHVTDLIREIEPIVAATRYKLADVRIMPNLPELAHRYVTIYEVEAETEDELNRLADAVREAMSSGAIEISPTLDMSTAIAAFLLPQGERRTS